MWGSMPLKVVGLYNWKRFMLVQKTEENWKGFYLASVHSLLSCLMEPKIVGRNLRERTGYHKQSLFHKAELGLVVIRFLFSLMLLPWATQGHKGQYTDRAQLCSTETCDSGGPCPGHGTPWTLGTALHWLTVPFWGSLHPSRLSVLDLKERRLNSGLSHP